LFLLDGVMGDALEIDLAIIPVLNKIDLPSAHPEEVRRQVSELLGVDPATILGCSAKTGEGVGKPD
jgi:GTP-binding protein LepA